MESIKRVRNRLGLSLTDVAERCGMHSQAIARIERVGFDPRASTVAAIAKALNVPVCELFEDSGHGRKPKKKTKSR